MTNPTDLRPDLFAHQREFLRAMSRNDGATLPLTAYGSVAFAWNMLDIPTIEQLIPDRRKRRRIRRRLGRTIGPVNVALSGDLIND